MVVLGSRCHSSMGPGCSCIKIAVALGWIEKGVFAQSQIFCIAATLYSLEVDRLSAGPYDT